jgi:hypothetical protein
MAMIKYSVYQTLPVLVRGLCITRYVTRAKFRVSQKEQAPTIFSRAFQSVIYFIRRTDNTTTHKKGDEDNDQQNAAQKID